MKLHNIRYILSLIILLSFTPQCAVTSVAMETSFSLLDDGDISIATGSPHGIYASVGSNMCRLINHNRKESQLRCSAVKSLGSSHNLVLLRKGEVDFAIMQSNWSKLGFDGVNSETQRAKANDQLRFVMSLHIEDLMLLTRRDSKIKALDDMKGGIMGSWGAYGNSKMSTILESLVVVKGWEKADFHSTQGISKDDHSAALCNKSVDVLVMVSGTPNAVLSDTARLCEVSLVPVDAATANAMHQLRNDFFRSSIAGGIYPGINRDVETVGVRAVLVTHASVSDKVVYQVVKSIVDNLEHFKKLHPSLADLDAKKMGTEGRVITMHPGAALYFAEKGIN